MKKLEKGETFANATIDDIEYDNFLEAKNEAFEWNDTTGQEKFINLSSFSVFAKLRYSDTPE